MSISIEAVDKVRSTINFILFDNNSFKIKNNEIITFAQLVRNVFRDWLERKNDNIIRFTFLELLDKNGQPLNPDSEIFIFWYTNRIKFAASLFIYAILPYYKLYNRNKKTDKHGELILELLDCLIDGKEFNKEHIKDCDLQYYWNNETSTYLGKIFELCNMTDYDFMNLPDDLDVWINT